MHQMYPSVNDSEFPTEEGKNTRLKSITIPIRNQLAEEMCANNVH